MIKEVLVVEGKMDVAAIDRAVEADCIITGGFRLAPRTLKDIEHAYRRRGIIILTDPDTAGERIRKFLSKRFPGAKHAFVPREEATANDDVGIEQASPGAIRKALEHVRTSSWKPSEEFTERDLMKWGLSGSRDAVSLRGKAGGMLGIGFANGKTFLKRLNNYGVTREEFESVMKNLSGV